MRSELMKKKLNRNRRRFLKNMGLASGALAMNFPMSAALAAGQLTFFNWDTYIGENTLAEFKDASGISVRQDIFADNSELWAKLREGNPGYDVIVPTNDYVHRMREADILHRLDHSQIPNFRQNIASRFQDGTFDPGRQFSMPYMWGTMGIGYRKSKVNPDDMKSWNAVWGSTAAKYSGRIAWISEADSMIGMALKSLGYSFNSTDKDQIKQAAEQLIAHKQHVKRIAEDDGQDLLLSGEVDIAVEWSGDIAQANSEDPDIQYIIPTEGSYFWQDCLCIPKGAPNLENAHTFINYLLDAQVGKDLAEYIEYATPNAAARKLTSEDYRNNTITFPPEGTNLEPSAYRGEDSYEFIDDQWTRILAS